MRLADNLAADLHLYLDAMATLDGPSDPEPCPLSLWAIRLSSAGPDGERPRALSAGSR